MAISANFTADTDIIQRLDDNPNESDLDAAGLKEAFDTGAGNVVKAINSSLIPAINSEITSAVSSASSSVTSTLEGEIGTLANLTTTAKSNLVSAINEVNSDTGWQNLTPTKGTWTYLRYRVMGKMVYVEGYASSYAWSGNVSDTIVNEGIPSEYRPASNIYDFGTVAGDRIARVYVSSLGNIGVDFDINISNGADYKTANWIQFRIIYFIN